MANIYTLKTGLASDPTVWSGGVVPVSGDRVLIDTGHVVTVDGTYTWGDDSTATVVINTVSTTAGIYINGTLKASRTVSSSLTCRGDLLVALNGTFDYGTEADPIPAAVTALIVANYSTAMAHNKYSVMTDTALNWAGFRMWGANKNPRSTILAATATDTVFTVADATLWAVGDVVVFGMSVAENTLASIRYRAITAITGNQITVGANLGFASQAGRSIMNLTRNVRVIGFQGNLYRSSVSVRVPGALAALGAIEIGCCEFGLAGGSASADRFGGLTLLWQSTTPTNANVKRVYRPVCHDVHSVVGSTLVGLNTGGVWAPLCCFNNQAYTYTIEEYVCSSMTQGNAILLYGGTSTCFTDVHMIRAARVAATGYSQGPVGCVFTGGYVESLAADIVGGSGIGVEFRGVTFNGLGRLSSNFTAFGSVKFSDCDLGGTFGFYIASTLYAATGGYAPAMFENCTVHPSFVTTRAGNLNVIKPASYFNFRNKNNDTTLQEIYRRGGRVLRDNATVSRGQSSLSLASWYAGEPITHASNVTVAANATVRIKGAVRFNAVYGTATPPTLTVSGMGITPVLFTAPAVADVWHSIDLTVTNPQSYPGTFTLDFSAMSAANTETAIAWFDGIAIPDFVTWTRHYGDTFDPINPARTANPVTQLTEAAAAALTGISYSAGTLTISGAHTVREVYDWMQWYECSNRLDPILVSADGTAFTLAADLTLTAELTGAGTLTLAAGKTYTNSGSTTLIVASDAGRFVKLTAPALISGSRVQIYNQSTATELYNDVLAADGLSITVVYTVNQIVRIRAEHSTKLPLETVGVLSSSGLSFLDVQDEDTTYIDNGIDGATVTEFAADGPNIQVDINDPDGITSVQRLYAWMQHYQTTAIGIASSFFGCMVATDDANYIVNQALADIQLDNVSASPVRVIGGYLSRKDGSTVIAPTSGSVQMDPGKAYVTGVSGVAASVRAELAPELARIDKPISSRASTGDVFAA